MTNPTHDEIADEVSLCEDGLVKLIEDSIIDPVSLALLDREALWDVRRRIWGMIRDPIVNIVCHQVRDPVVFSLTLHGD